MTFKQAAVLVARIVNSFTGRKKDNAAGFDLWSHPNQDDIVRLIYHKSSRLSDPRLAQHAKTFRMVLFAFVALNQDPAQGRADISDYGWDLETIAEEFQRIGLAEYATALRNAQEEPTEPKDCNFWDYWLSKKRFHKSEINRGKRVDRQLVNYAQRFMKEELTATSTDLKELGIIERPNHPLASNESEKKTVEWLRMIGAICGDNENPNSVRMVQLSSDSTRTDWELFQLSRNRVCQRSLVMLNCSNTELHPESFRHFRSFENLADVILDGMELDSSSLQTLVEQNSITSYSLRDVSSKGLLCDCNFGRSCVRDLWLDGCDRIDFENVTRIGSLKPLSLGRTNVRDCDLIHLGELRSLEYLSLEHTLVTGQALEHIKSLPNLQTLDLTGCDLNVEDLVSSLPKMRRLSWLYLPENLVNDGRINGLTRRHGNVRVRFA